MFQKSEDRTRMTFLRKITEKRQKIKQTQNEIQQVQKKMQDMELFKAEFVRQKDKKETEANVLKECTKDIIVDLEESKTNRQLFFERLVMQQKKIKLYNDLILNRKPFTCFKTDEHAMKEYCKQRCLSTELTSVTEFLRKHYPQYAYEIERMANTLKVGYFIMFS